MNEQQSDWGPGDIFVTSSWGAVDHEADEISSIFEITDRPVLEALGFIAETTEAVHQAVRTTFDAR